MPIEERLRLVKSAYNFIQAYVPQNETERDYQHKILNQLSNFHHYLTENSSYV